MLPWQLLTFLPGKEAIFPWQLLTFPFKGNSSPQANSQASGSLLTLAIAHLPPREGSNSLLGDAHLPLGEGNSSAQATVLLPSGEGSNSSQASSLLPYNKGHSSPQASSSTQAGQVIILPGHLGRAIGSPLGTGQPSLPRSLIPPPGKTTRPPSPSRHPKVLLMKNLTLSGSLTFPTNP